MVVLQSTRTNKGKHFLQKIVTEVATQHYAGAEEPATHTGGASRLPEINELAGSEGTADPRVGKLLSSAIRARDYGLQQHILHAGAKTLFLAREVARILMECAFEAKGDRLAREVRAERRSVPGCKAGEALTLFVRNVPGLTDKCT
jgi:hypothetical protein